MEGPLGALIARCFRVRNLIDAGVRFGLDDLTVEEVQVLEIIEMERPRSGTELLKHGA